MVPEKGRAIALGYKADETECALHFSSLQGFVLAVGSRGILGIQCVLEDGRKSPWVGCTRDALKTRRLAVSGPIVAIKAGFDGLKMVSLAVAEPLPPAAGNDTTKRQSLRDSAFWYPEIPGGDLQLNEDHFAAIDTSINRYRPLCWTHFGGPGVS